MGDTPHDESDRIEPSRVEEDITICGMTVMAGLSDDTTRRLTFIRFLFEAGVEQSRAPEPRSAQALLTFHDSVEQFFGLTCEHLNVAVSGKTQFMEYFKLINSKLAAHALTQQRTLDRMNRARVEFKHHSLFPTSGDINGFRSTCKAFFTENCPKVFDIAFGDVSMARLITAAPIRVELEKADEHIRAGDWKAAIESIAVGFARLLDQYDLASNRRFVGHVPHREPIPAYEAINELLKYLRPLEQEVALLSHRVDTRKFAAFRKMTPHVFIAQAGNHTIMWPPSPSGFGDVQTHFCYNFVVDTALRLQDSDPFTP